MKFLKKLEGLGYLGSVVPVFQVILILFNSFNNLVKLNGFNKNHQRAVIAEHLLFILIFDFRQLVSMV